MTLSRTGHCAKGTYIVYSYTITSPDRPFGFLEVEAPRISIQPAHADVEVVSPSHRPPLPPSEILLVGISVSGSVDSRADTPE